MTPLPLARDEDRQFFESWLTSFATHVREVDYTPARQLIHPDVVIFGTHQDVVTGRENWISQQWNNVWPKTEGFTFDLRSTRILVSDDRTMATLVAPWTSIGFHPDGAKFDRPGRATMVFHRGDDGWKV